MTKHASSSLVTFVTHKRFVVFNVVLSFLRSCWVNSPFIGTSRDDDDGGGGGGGHGNENGKNAIGLD